MQNSMSDRNLLFGILAVQNDLISQDDLIHAMNAWLLESSKSIGQILVDQSRLDQVDCDLLDQMIRRHIAKNSGDLKKAIGAISSAEYFIDSLKQLNHSDLQVGIATIKLGEADYSNKSDSKPKMSDGGVKNHQGTDSSNRRAKQKPEGGWKAGRFRVIRPLGGGGMGKVYEGYDDEELGRRVAIKMLHEDRFMDHDRLERFRIKLRKEGEINGNLEHPNIIPVYGLGTTDDGRPFYVMRFIDRINLHQAIRNFHADKPLLYDPAKEDPTLNNGIEKSDAGQMEETILAVPDVMKKKAGTNQINSHKMKFHRLSGSQNLAFRELLERFTDICDAIDYAHSKRVLHRDLKPGNIMLGEHGETLVIDWGLAKTQVGEANEKLNEEESQALIVDSDMLDDESQHGELKGTMGYMAPEQLSGDLTKFNETTDVFSLGAILFEILTGHAPFLDKEKRYELDQIRDVRKRAERLLSFIEKESKTPRQVNHTIPRPLASICAKALTANQADRYQTANALAFDVEKWLAGEPVSAYSENVFERCRRWARKHRSIVAMMASSFVILAGGSIFYAIELGKYSNDLANKNLEVERQRSISDMNEKLAIDSVRRFAEAVSQEPQLKNLPELAELREKLLNEPVRFYRNLTAVSKNSAASGQNSLQKIGDGAFELGKLLYELGNQEEAFKSYQQALENYQEIGLLKPNDNTAQLGIAKCYHSIGRILNFRNEIDNAIVSYKKALYILKHISESDPDNIVYALALASTYNNLGNIAHDQRSSDEFDYHLKAADIRERMGRKYPENPKPKLDLAATFLNLGNSYKDIHQDEKGLEYYRKSVKVYESLLVNDHNNTEIINHLAKSIHNIAVWLADRNRPQEALVDYIKVLKYQETNVISHPSTVEYLKDYSGTNYNIGNLYLSLGRTDDAFSSFQKAIKIQQEIIQLNPTNVVYQIELSSTLNSTAMLYRKLGNRKEALSNHLRAIDIQRNLYLTSKSTTQMKNSLADNLNEVAWWIALNPGQSLEIYQQAIHLSKESISMKPIGLVYADTLALAQYRAGFFNDALDTIKKLRSGLKPITDSDVTPSHLAILSLCLFKTDHKTDAMKSYNQMVMIIQKDKYKSDLDSQALFKECTVTIYPTDLPLDPFQK